MVRRFLISFLFIALAQAAYALDPAEKVLDADAHPSTKELYENCKSALKLAEAGNRRAFMESQCGVFMHGFFVGASIFDFYTSDSNPKSDEFFKADMSLCNISEIGKTENPSAKIILTTIALADRFVRDYEAKIVDPERLKYNQKPHQIAFRERSRASSPLGWIYFSTSECN